MLLTGHDPIATYQAIFEGTGLQWLLPWVTGAERDDRRAQPAADADPDDAADPRRAGGGLRVPRRPLQHRRPGPVHRRAIAAVWVGSSFAGMPGFLHVVLAMVAACLAGAVWAGIAGLLKATIGANEVISTIMLNYTALWLGVYLFSLGGPLQNDTRPSVPISNDIVASAHLPVFWGDPVLQGLHIGLFVALAAVVVFWLLLNRSTNGYEVRAVGLNPEAARYGGINVGQELRAGDGGLRRCSPGWPARWTSSAGSSGSRPTTSRSRRSASSASPSRCSGATRRSGPSRRRCCSAALLSGTSQRNLDPTIFEPELAANLTTIIQGLVVLVVSADVLVLGVLRRGRRAPAGGGDGTGGRRRREPAPRWPPARRG